jgi:phosphate uptake regulator
MEKHPEEAKEQLEQDQENEKQYWKDFEAYKRLMKETPDGVINYLIHIHDELENIKYVLRKNETKQQKEQDK